MKIVFTATTLFFLLYLSANAQPGQSQTVEPQKTTKKKLFKTDEILEITLTGNTKPLFNNRSGDAKKFPFTLSYQEENGTEYSMPVKVKTRGHFRRMKENCRYPPLLVQFPSRKKALSGTFPQKARLKLVMPCAAEEYVVKEWLVYKIYNLVTEQSFRSRLVKVNFKSEKSAPKASSMFGILVEEEKQMAKRNNAVIVKHKLRAFNTEFEPFLRMAVFQYLIGNTDWSVEFLQNIKLIAKDSTSIPIAVPYDFDHAGIVNAPYAEPADVLKMTSVRERRFRGYCISDMKSFDSTIALLNRLKPSIYKLYTDCDLINEKYIKSTIKYLDEFYETLNNPEALQKEFGYPCDKSGTGNVILKGLRDEQE